MNRTSFVREQGGAPVDQRYLRSVYQNGVQIGNAKLASGVSIITSTGSLGPYTIGFAPVIYSVAPIVTAWCSQESGGNGVIVNLATINTTGVSFFMAIPGVGIITAGHTVTVEWIAVGT